MHGSDVHFSPTVAGGTGPTIVTQNIHNYAPPGFGATILPPGPPPPPAPGPAEDGKNSWQTKILLWTFGLVCVVLSAVLLQALILKPQPPERGQDDKGLPGSKTSEEPVKPEPPIISPVPPVTPPKQFSLQFDRRDVIYHQDDKQHATIHMPSAGYLYVASVWAAENGTYSLFHPAWSAGLEVVEKAGTDGPTTYRLSHRLLAQAQNAGMLGRPHRFEAGDTLLLPDTILDFPKLPDPSVNVAFEHVLAILSEELLPGITAFYGKGDHDEGNIEPALIRLGLLKPNQISRTRGGLPPSLIEIQPLPKFKSTSAVYEMRRSPRK